VSYSRGGGSEERRTFFRDRVPRRWEVEFSCARFFGLHQKRVSCKYRLARVTAHQCLRFGLLVGEAATHHHKNDDAARVQTINLPSTSGDKTGSPQAPTISRKSITIWRVHLGGRVSWASRDRVQKLARLDRGCETKVGENAVVVTLSIRAWWTSVEDLKTIAVSWKAGRKERMAGVRSLA
jgi:hypothetical protein